ncbi:hypothetical protein [Pseudomonas kulmbachensis]|uniref:DUF4156 domain-containing protein n=1 Tax=Pseudomonas kulmbachensis TaxID=3043408 RepID=A0ABW7LTF6_9PSED
MRAPSLLIMAFTALASLAACTTQLTSEGAKVDFVTASAASQCDEIKMFTVQGSGADEALRIAFNEAATLGADSMILTSGKRLIPE